MLTKQAVEFPYAGEHLVQLVSVYDGDTFTIKFVHGKDVIQTKLRIAGIDTPEIRTRNLYEKQRGHDARRFACGLFTCNEFYKAHFIGPDKYHGRIIGDIQTDDGQWYSQMALDQGIAHDYDGGTKQTWECSSACNNGPLGC